MVQFQKDAQTALDAESPDSEKLEQLIEFSVTLDVDLPEIPKLKQVSYFGHCSPQIIIMKDWIQSRNICPKEVLANFLTFIMMFAVCVL